jgi:aspartate kinase
MSKQTKEITTLGRGGSDTTAVAMCSALGARSCQILKDFPGVYTADPKVVKDAQVISELTYDQLIEMTGSGAKMVHSRAAIMAKEKQIKLEIIAAASSDRTAAAGREGGTSISKFSDPKKSRPSINVLQIDQSSSQVTVTLPELASDKKLTEITAFLSQSKINFKFDKTFGHSMAFRVSSTDLDLCLQSLHKFLINT